MPETELVDLASSNGNGRRHGKVVWGDVPMGEQGSNYGGDSLLFARWENGKVFSIDDVKEQDYEEMLRLDGKARTLEQVLTLPLLAAEHFLEPADGDQGETDFIREVLFKPANAGGMTTPFELVLAQMTSAIIYRRAYFEKVFKVDGDRVVYHKLAFRPAKTCWLLRDKSNYSFQGFKQKFATGDGEQKEEVIKPEKALVYIHGQHRDQLNGQSDLETAYAIYQSKQKVKFLWFSFLENLVLPKALAKGRDPDKLAKKVATLKGGGVIGLDTDDSVEAFESNNGAADVFKAAIEYLDIEEANSVLAGFTQLPNADGKGSYALSKDHSDFFLRSRTFTLGELAATLTSFAIADLIKWNFGMDGKAPTFKFKPLAEEAVTDALDLFKALSSRQTPDPRVPDVFLELLVEKVAAHLGLDVEKVRKAIENRDETNPTDRLRAGLDRAAELVTAAGIGDGSQPAIPESQTAATPPATA